MKILFVGENPSILVLQENALSAAYPRAEFEAAQSVAQVKRKCTKGHYDLIISDFTMPGIHPKEWPGFLYTFFPRSKLVVLYREPAQVEPMHDMLFDRCLFLDRNQAQKGLIGLISSSLARFSACKPKPEHHGYTPKQRSTQSE